MIFLTNLAEDLGMFPNISPQDLLCFISSDQLDIYAEKAESEQ